MTETILNTIGDTYITTSNKTTNYSTSNYFYTYGTGQYSILQFDFSEIPSGETIISAVLSAYYYNESGGGNSNLDVYRIKQACVMAQTTWNVYSTNNNWETAGALGENDYDSVSLGQATCTGTTYGWTNWTLSPTEINKFTNGTYTNNGFIIRGSANKYTYFRSLEYSSNIPYLTINHALASSFVPRVMIF